MLPTTPSFESEIKTKRLIKDIKPHAKIGLIGAKDAVEPEKSLIAGTAVDFVARNEFDFTVKEAAEEADWTKIRGISYRNRQGVIVHNDDREILENMDALPWVTPVDNRDVAIEDYSI